MKPKLNHTAFRKNVQIGNSHLLQCKKREREVFVACRVFTLPLQSAHTTAPTSGADSNTDKHLLQGEAQRGHRTPGI